MFVKMASNLSGEAMHYWQEAVCLLFLINMNGRLSVNAQTDVKSYVR